MTIDSYKINENPEKAKETILYRQIDVRNAIATAFDRAYKEKKTNLAELFHLMKDELDKIEMIRPYYSAANLVELQEKISKEMKQ